MKEPVLIRTLRLQFHLLNSINKSTKDGKMGNNSYISSFTFSSLKL